jgi:hypothetical protein
MLTVSEANGKFLEAISVTLTLYVFIVPGMCKTSIMWNKKSLEFSVTLRLQFVRRVMH